MSRSVEAVLELVRHCLYVLERKVLKVSQWVHLTYLQNACKSAIHKPYTHDEKLATVSSVFHSQFSVHLVSNKIILKQKRYYRE